MNIVIIEDEKITATDLAQTIESVVPESKIQAILGSVKAAISYFQTEAKPVITSYSIHYTKLYEIIWVTS